MEVRALFDLFSMRFLAISRLTYSFLLKYKKLIIIFFGMFFCSSEKENETNLIGKRRDMDFTSTAAAAEICMDATSAPFWSKHGMSIYFRSFSKRGVFD